MITKANRHWLIIFIFSVSGFTGLIYESIWSHYLKLFLGHAAYAQALVLVIFMGGMAFGSWFIGARSVKQTNLLLLYALAEGIIGVLGLVFHPVFEFILDFSYNTLLPGLSPGWVHAVKWLIGSALILPQSFLLGTTFPLICNGLLRRHEGGTGSTVSILYFSNSIGAAIGVLVSGFILLKAFGLPGTIMTAALINILLALVVYLLAKTDREQLCFSNDLSSRDLLPITFLIAAFLTGMASFIYEISWIRMLSMVLGSSTHAFELMLSAFIAGLAFGGLWIRKRIDRISDPVAFAAGVQIIMGLLAIITIPLYNFTYEIMSLSLSALARTETGYFFYSLTGHLICLLVMLPATFCAGMTFPLFSTILLQRGYGERSIGYVYAANTIGAIFGVLFTIFIGLPLLGMKGSIIFGSGIDIILGFALLVFLVKSVPVSRTVLNFLVCAGVLATAFYLTEIDRYRIISGVYRSGTSLMESARDILYYKDGKTATISVTRLEDGRVVIATNGKPDAAINMRENTRTAALDEITMVMAGALPLLINPDIRQVANIGMGSGLTSHTILEWPGIEQLDTVEIEAAMVEGARHYLPRVDNVFNDPRSRINIEDAKTFFSLNQHKYDLIISEPSNPWVSGTASLFTLEFYREIKRYLVDGGLLAQWIQIYELDTSLLMSVFKALQVHFPYFEIYTTDNSNLLIIASAKPIANTLDSAVFDNPGLAAELQHVGIYGIQDIKTRYLGNERVFGNLIRSFNISHNSDYFPVLDLNAERSRFLQHNALNMTEYRTEGLPLINLLLPGYYDENRTRVTDNKWHTFSHLAWLSMNLYAYFMETGEMQPDSVAREAQTAVYVLKHPRSECSAPDYEPLWLDAIFRLMYGTLPYLQPGELNDLIETINGACRDTMTLRQLQWLVLYKALAQGNARLSLDTGMELLAAGNLDPARKRFLFKATVLSAIVDNQHAVAANIWNEHIRGIYRNSDIPFAAYILQSLIEDTGL
jgi:predicted membrane-bound spermidine synthase